VDKPFDLIMDDLYTRADRLVDKLIVEEEENKHSAFRPEFTIRNIHLPLEGRLDLIRIRFPNISQSSYISFEKLQNLDGAEVQVTQIKTGRYKRPSAVWNLQVDAETLLLMKAFNLQSPPEYIWQFSDKDSHRKKFNFAKVHQYIDRVRDYTLDNIVTDIDGVNSFNRAEIGRKYFQNAQIILTTAYSAKDLAKIIKVGAVIVDETGLITSCFT
jgi:hypothetical protein